MLVGTEYATGDQWRNNSRKNEGMEPKQTQYPVVDVTGDRRLQRVPWTARRPNQSILKETWVFIGRTDAEAETPIVWPLHEKNGLIGKDPGRDQGQEEKGMTEEEMTGWHH